MTKRTRIILCVLVVPISFTLFSSPGAGYGAVTLGLVLSIVLLWFRGLVNWVVDDHKKIHGAAPSFLHSVVGVYKAISSGVYWRNWYSSVTDTFHDSGRPQDRENFDVTPGSMAILGIVVCHLYVVLIAVAEWSGSDLYYYWVDLTQPLVLLVGMFSPAINTYTGELMDRGFPYRIRYVTHVYAMMFVLSGLLLSWTVWRSRGRLGCFFQILEDPNSFAVAYSGRKIKFLYPFIMFCFALSFGFGVTLGTTEFGQRHIVTDFATSNISVCILAFLVPLFVLLPVYFFIHAAIYYPSSFVRWLRRER